MALISFLKPKNKLEEGGRSAAPLQRDDGEPEKTCPSCHKSIPLSRLWANDLVCACGYHFRMKADRDSFHELYSDVKAGNPLNFPGYRDKIDTVRAASGEEEAVVCGTAKIGGQSCCLFVMESYFMMGSMGTAVGEKITLIFEYATKHRRIYRFGRRAYAGGTSFPYADGKNKRRGQKTQRRGTALYMRFDRPYHGRSNSQFRHGG